MRRTHLCLLIGLSISTPLSAMATDFDSLENWVGSYPIREKGGKKEQILKDTIILKYLKNLLERNDIKRVENYDQSLPIENIKGFIVISRCKPRLCAAERSLIVLDSKSDRIWAGFYERLSNKVIVRWYGNKDDYFYLPAEIIVKLSDKKYE